MAKRGKLLDVRQLSIADWQKVIDQCGIDKSPELPPLAMRMENTQLMVCRHYGGCNFRGHTYTVYHCRDVEEVRGFAWLMVRSDVVKWAEKNYAQPVRTVDKTIEQPGLFGA